MRIEILFVKNENISVLENNDFAKMKNIPSKIKQI